MLRTVMIACCLLIGSLVAKAQKTESPISSQWVAGATVINKGERDRLTARLFKFKLDYPASARQYSKGNVLVSYQEATAAEHEHFDLKNKQAQFVSLYNDTQEATIKKSDIQQIGGRQFLIIQSQIKGDGLYTFCSDIYNGNKYVHGTIQFRPEDEKYATAILTELLAGK